MSGDWSEFLYLDEKPIVCTIHRCFIPCRHGREGLHCVYSDDPDEVEAVRKYQSGE